jgi:hypothetical protein
MSIRTRIARLEVLAAEVRAQASLPRVVICLPYNPRDGRLPGRYPLGPNVEMVIDEAGSRPRPPSPAKGDN